MTSSDDDRSGMNRSKRDQSILDLVSGPGDEAVRAALQDLASLAEAPAPAPTEALAAVFDTRPGPQRTRRSPGRIAGGTTAFVGLLVASGTAAAALGGGIPWIDDEPATPRAAATHPSESDQPPAGGPYADAVPHARTSPRASGEAPRTVTGATPPAPVRTTASPTDLPRVAVRGAGRGRPTELTLRRSSSRGGPTEGTLPVEHPTVADATVPDATVPQAEGTPGAPELGTDAAAVLPADPADAGEADERAAGLAAGPGSPTSGEPATEAAATKRVHRVQGKGPGEGQGQGNPAKVATPLTAAMPVTPQGKPPTEPVGTEPKVSRPDVASPDAADAAEAGPAGSVAQP